MDRRSGHIAREIHPPQSLIKINKQNPICDQFICFYRFLFVVGRSDTSGEEQVRWILRPPPVLLYGVGDTPVDPSPVLLNLKFKEPIMSDGESLKNQQNNEGSQGGEFVSGGLVMPSIKKGRFLIESAKQEVFSSMRKGRFSISNTECCSESKLIFEIIEKQNEQIETLFDIINNISGADKLFHKEFHAASAAASEKLERLRSLFSNFGSS